MLDTWTLRVLITVGELGSFSAAAEKLRMTQPAVSRQIAGLERRLGVRLFTRVPRGVRPTPAGAAALDLATDVVDRLTRLEARLASFAELASGELRLSGFPSVNCHLVPEAIRRFAGAHPGVALSLVQAGQMPLTAVREGSVDVALVTEWHLYADPGAAKHAPVDADPPRAGTDGVDLVPLLDEELRVVLPAGHPLARQRRVRLADLSGASWIEGNYPDCLGPIEALAQALGGPPRIGFWCDDWNGKQALVAAGAGITLVPTTALGALRPDVVALPTLPELPARPLYAAAPVPSLRSPAVNAMLQVLVGVASGDSREDRLSRMRIDVTPVAAS